MHAQSLIESVQANLERGSQRLFDSQAQMKLSWFPEYERPTFADWLVSGMSLDNEGKKDDATRRLCMEFWEEVNALSELVPEGSKDSLTGWQKSSLPSVQEMHLEQNRRATALALWDWYGVPLRVMGNHIYRIWAPRDIFGDPIIKFVPIDEFLNRLCEKTALDQIEFAKLNNKLTNWRFIAGACICVILVYLLVLIR